MAEERNISGGQLSRKLLDDYENGEGENDVEEETAQSTECQNLVLGLSKSINEIKSRQEDLRLGEYSKKIDELRKKITELDDAKKTIESFDKIPGQAQKALSYLSRLQAETRTEIELLEKKGQIPPANPAAPKPQSELIITKDTLRGKVREKLEAASREDLMAIGREYQVDLKGMEEAAQPALVSLLMGEIGLNSLASFLGIATRKNKGVVTQPSPALGELPDETKDFLRSLEAPRPAPVGEIPVEPTLIPEAKADNPSASSAADDLDSLLGGQTSNPEPAAVSRDDGLDNLFDEPLAGFNDLNPEPVAPAPAEEPVPEPEPGRGPTTGDLSRGAGIELGENAAPLKAHDMPPVRQPEEGQERTAKIEQLTGQLEESRREIRQSREWLRGIKVSAENGEIDPSLDKTTFLANIKVETDAIKEARERIIEIKKELLALREDTEAMYVEDPMAKREEDKWEAEILAVLNKTGEEAKPEPMTTMEKVRKIAAAYTVKKGSQTLEALRAVPGIFLDKVKNAPQAFMESDRSTKVLVAGAALALAGGYFVAPELALAGRLITAGAKAWKGVKQHREGKSAGEILWQFGKGIVYGFAIGQAAVYAGEFAGGALKGGLKEGWRALGVNDRTLMSRLGEKLSDLNSAEELQAESQQLHNMFDKGYGAGGDKIAEQLNPRIDKLNEEVEKLQTERAAAATAAPAELEAARKAGEVATYEKLIAGQRKMIERLGKVLGKSHAETGGTGTAAFHSGPDLGHQRSYGASHRNPWDMIDRAPHRDGSEVNADGSGTKIEKLAAEYAANQRKLDELLGEAEQASSAPTPSATEAPVSAQAPEETTPPTPPASDQEMKPHIEDETVSGNLNESNFPSASETSIQHPLGDKWSAEYLKTHGHPPFNPAEIGPDQDFRAAQMKWIKEYGPMKTEDLVPKESSLVRDQLSKAPPITQESVESAPTTKAPAPTMAEKPQPNLPPMPGEELETGTSKTMTRGLRLPPTPASGEDNIQESKPAPRQVPKPIITMIDGEDARADYNHDGKISEEEGMRYHSTDHSSEADSSEMDKTFQNTKEAQADLAEQQKSFRADHAKGPDYRIPGKGSLAPDAGGEDVKGPNSDRLQKLVDENKTKIDEALKRRGVSPIGTQAPVAQPTEPTVTTSQPQPRTPFGQTLNDARTGTVADQRPHIENDLKGGTPRMSESERFKLVEEVRARHALRGIGATGMTDTYNMPGENASELAKEQAVIHAQGGPQGGDYAIDPKLQKENLDYLRAHENDSPSSAQEVNHEVADSRSTAEIMRSAGRGAEILRDSDSKILGQHLAGQPAVKDWPLGKVMKEASGDGPFSKAGSPIRKIADAIAKDKKVVEALAGLGPKNVWEKLPVSRLVRIMSTTSEGFIEKARQETITPSESDFK